MYHKMLCKISARSGSYNRWETRCFAFAYVSLYFIGVVWWRFSAETYSFYWQKQRIVFRSIVVSDCLPFYAVNECYCMDYRIAGVKRAFDCLMVSRLQPFACLVRVALKWRWIWTSCNDTDRGKLKQQEITLLLCNLVLRETQMNRTGHDTVIGVGPPPILFFSTRVRGPSGENVETLLSNY